MSREVDAYIKRWFAKQRGETVSPELITDPYIKRWFAEQRGETPRIDDSASVFSYTTHYIKQINDEKT